MLAQYDFPDPQDRGGSEPDARHLARQIDRLVTGDLDDPDRAALLRWLDAEPARWRRCAMAFLEAQTIRESLAEWNEGEPASPDAIDLSAATERRAADGAAETSVPRSLPRGGGPKSVRWNAVAAAAVLLAFMVGWAGGKSAQVVDVAATPGSVVQPPGTATSPPRAGQRNDRFSQDSPSSFVAAFVPESSHGTPVVRIRNIDGPRVRQILLPVAEKKSPYDLAAAGEVIPQYVRAQWERQGYQVVEDRRLMPLKLADGRNVVMPVSRVTLNYVGRPSL